MSRVSAHGCLKITRDFCPHGHLYLEYNSHAFVWKLLHLPLEIRYMGAYLGVGDCPGYYDTCISKIKPEQNYPTIPQHPPVHVRCTHQSMPIEMTLSTELRVLVLNVGTIQVTMGRVPFSL